MPPTYKYFDGGEWKYSANKETMEVVSPVDNQTLGKIPKLTKSEIDGGITYLSDKKKMWTETPVAERVKIIRLAADILRHHEHFFTSLIIREIGKPYHEAKDEVVRSADMMDYFGNEAINLKGEEIESSMYPGYNSDKIAFVERVPLGIILAISPFNYPLNLAVSKIAPALITGNLVVFKPATQGALTGFHLTEVLRLAGLPDGIIFTVTGDKEAVSFLISHKEINQIAFTGSSETGESLAKQSGMVPLLFECGGNNAAIILPDANLHNTATELVSGAFSYSGQRCTAIKYVLAYDTVIEKLIPILVKKTQEKIKMGDPRNQNNNFGPLISAGAADTVEKRIYLAKISGAGIITGGKREGNYLEPTIIDHAKPNMEIVAVETFGPILSFIRIRSMRDAIDIINQSKYGLQTSIFTEDEGAGIKLSRQLNVGSVQINGKPQRGPDHFPFTGVKASGTGVQGVGYTMKAMTRPKATVLNKPG
ncbi:hypothetical protein A2Y99_00870 [Candidatus Gottesmanbacteria bacterium RBG_13_37_7]|uniref:Aldehyde dehydrogenase domain-containing protein n=1 Tax=Candidatus Gottesmanbacteria bacterium RBG_13_37_7 TaxID=1798369 RepID=A0A1F5YJR7_9BACT|nr:MAG: hypothetical protein A2Y99_00870 [Candidatus Gottesmanbacteria bacterium RBG_13_37_7]